MRATFRGGARTIKATAALLVLGGCAIVAGAAATGASISACSSQPPEPGGPSSPTSGSPAIGSTGPAAETGTIGMHLTIGAGVNLYSLSYTCTGPAAISPGTVTFGDAQSVEYVLGGITPGSGYQCVLTGFDSNGDYCTGTTTTFSVTAGQVSSAGVNVVCLTPAAAIGADVQQGSVYVDAAVQLDGQAPYACPGISAFSISPAELVGFQPSQLSLTEIGPQSGLGADGGPSSSNITWSASCLTPPCGQFETSDGGPGQSSATPTFVCSATPQAVTVTAQITQYETTLTPTGPVTTNVCNGLPFTLIASTINCEGICPDAGLGVSCGDAGQICNGGGTCVVPQFDIVRVGDGGAALTAATAPAFIDQYYLNGTLVDASIPLPTAVSGSNEILTLIGIDNTEGDLTTSTNGQFIVLGGHNTAPGSAPLTGNPVVGLINAAGTVNTSTTVANAFVDGGVVRSAVSNDGNEAWLLGTAIDLTGGLWYSTVPAGTAAQLYKAGKSTGAGPQGRWLTIAGGQLYGDTTVFPPGLVAVGSGTPTSGTPTLGTLPGTPDSGTMAANFSPFGIVFFQLNPASTGLDTLYVADDRASGGGLLKFSFNGTKWMSDGELGGTGGTGYRGLAGYATGTTVTLMATTGVGGGGSDELVLIVDSNGLGTTTSTITQTPLVTSPLNTAFRGVAIPPHP